MDILNLVSSNNIHRECAISAKSREYLTHSKRSSIRRVDVSISARLEGAGTTDATDDLMNVRRDDPGSDKTGEEIIDKNDAHRRMRDTYGSNLCVTSCEQGNRIKA